jgi:hypothetical protein
MEAQSQSHILITLSISNSNHCLLQNYLSETLTFGSLHSHIHHAEINCHCWNHRSSGNGELWPLDFRYLPTSQGGSVAKAFLEDPTYKIRGITRDPTKAESQALISQGIEIVKGDAEDVQSLKLAFKGADVIFGNTAFSNAFAMPTEADIAKLKPGQTLREWCYETEVQQGKNIIDAVATVEGLELFIWSALSHSKKWSKGKYSGIYHFDSKATVVDYINEAHPNVAKKTSQLQMGLFITNWKWGQAAVPWEKVDPLTLMCFAFTDICSFLMDPCC